MSLRPEIERALRFIGDNLERPISVAEVARAAYLSEFHLHRVFHAAVGESIGRFITRRRLELAALRLAYEPDRSITEIALSSGYSSSSNFSKAFALHFGCSPSRVRQPEIGLPAPVGRLALTYGKEFRPEALYAAPRERDPSERVRIAEAWEARLRFEQGEARRFACLAGPNGYDPDVLVRTWHELIRRMRQLGAVAGEVDAWGIAYDSPNVTAPELCRYHACVPCAPTLVLPQPLFTGWMEEGRYAVFAYRGSTSALAEAYREIYSCWFPLSSLAPEGYQPLERYVSDFPEQGQVELELWFRVRSQRAG